VRDADVVTDLVRDHGQQIVPGLKPFNQARTLHVAGAYLVGALARLLVGGFGGAAG